MESVYDFVRRNVMKHQEELQEKEDPKKEPYYEEGNWVKRIKVEKAEGRNVKFCDKFYPIIYEICRKISSSTFILRDTQTGIVDDTPRNVEHIRHWHGKRVLIPTPEIVTMRKGKEKYASCRIYAVSEILDRRITEKEGVEYEVRFTGYGTRSTLRHQ